MVQWTAISYQQSIKHLENLAELSTEPRAVNAIRRWERLEYDQQKVTVIQWRIGTADGRDFCNKKGIDLEGERNELSAMRRHRFSH